MEKEQGNQEESQVISLRELLQTSKNSHKKIVTCKACQNEFETRIYVKDDGTEIQGQDNCPDCRRKTETEEHLKYLEQELKDNQQELWERWHRICGVPALFRDKTFDNFERELHPTTYDKIRNLGTKSMVLLSPNMFGVGKTHLVCALANHLIDTTEPAYFEEGTHYIKCNEMPVLVISEIKMLSSLRDTYGRDRRDTGDETEEGIFQRLLSVPLLIIDDVGKMKPRDMAWTQGVYFRIIDDRYVNQRQIVLTTNLNMAELEEHIGGACADRLREMCGSAGFSTMKGESYRKRKGKQ